MEKELNLIFVDEILTQPSFIFTPEDFIEDGVSQEEIEKSWGQYILPEEIDDTNSTVERL